MTNANDETGVETADEESSAEQEINEAEFLEIGHASYRVPSER